LRIWNGESALTLEIEQRETENRELELTVRVDESRVEEAMRRTARKFSRNIRIPGFRPGKAPFHVIRNWVGADALRAEAIDSIANDIYQEATEQADVIPFAPGSLDDIELDPLVFHITVPLYPKVDLGDYRDVRVEPTPVEIADEAVNEAMQAIREKHALLEPANRPAQKGDVVIADLHAEEDGDEVLSREKAELLLDPDQLYPDTPFVENIVGMSAGDEKTFQLVLTDEENDESHELAYTVKLHEVKSRFVPPLNDELAREEGDFETLLDLRIHVRKQLTEAAQREADADYVEKVFDQIREGTAVVYPPAALEQEIDRMVDDMEERFGRQGWSLDDHLKLQGKTVDDLREELRPEAEDYLMRSQITFALVQAERLAVEDGELESKVGERLGRMEDLEEEAAQQLRELYTTGQGRMLMANEVLMEKYTERLKAIGRGQAPELPELSELPETSDEEE
jgi:trigger factor